ncbi:MAG: cysteine--tRNA ligase [Deltaproteobacteria bacterium RBG_13_43_22]|nr:MAG: cysteine--tRNA ligase [Deltaproteobacteria bacterium RBG_13_43_22]
MPLKIYNSQTKQKEPFDPLNPPQVGIYVCGVTVYDSCHIGHARSMIVFDVMVRLLRFKGFQVTYVRNFTDIDDKIIARARQEEVDPKTLAEKYIQEFEDDMKVLGVLTPDFEPRATLHIPEIIGLVQKLVDQKAAYMVEGDVFFAVEKFSAYGALSHRTLEEMQAGARIEVDPRKHHPMDFALWKKGKPGEPVWDSPWGPGRPGWHIECSAMSSRYLGETFDIHGGGKDLIFPHHENELAQSMAVSCKPLARYWIHNGFVTIQGEKMSKSLGNFLTIQEMVRRFYPEAIRLLLLSRHYRSPLDYSDQAMQEAQMGLNRFYTLLKDLEHPEDRLQNKGNEPLVSERIKEAEEAVGRFKENFQQALEDDFNTAQAIGHMYELTRQLNRTMDTVRPKELKGLADPFNRAAGLLKQYGQLLGILTRPPQDFLDQEKTRLLNKKGLSAETIERLIAERNQARKEKDWARADGLRERLVEMNILLKDSPRGTIWQIEE